MSFSFNFFVNEILTKFCKTLYGKFLIWLISSLGSLWATMHGSIPVDNKCIQAWLVKSPRAIGLCTNIHCIMHKILDVVLNHMQIGFNFYFVFTIFSNNRLDHAGSPSGEIKCDKNRFYFIIIFWQKSHRRVRKTINKWCRALQNNFSHVGNRYCILLIQNFLVQNNRTLN